MLFTYFLIISILVLVIISALVAGIFKADFSNIESAKERAGRRGEQYATQIIKEVLQENDFLLTNVKISFEGKMTELDNVIINNRGVFIFEVKYYVGKLIGNEDDYEWFKNKITKRGYLYQKKVKNPIKQVKRQIYILSNYLKHYGIDVWVMGYAFILGSKSPVKSDCLLETQKEISDRIHFGKNNNLTIEKRNMIIKLLSE